MDADRGLEDWLWSATVDLIRFASLAYCGPQAVLNGPASEVLSHGRARRTRIAAQLFHEIALPTSAPSPIR